MITELKIIGKIASQVLIVKHLPENECECSTSRKNDALILKFEDKTSFRLQHNDQCCESVVIEDICGDLNDLLGVPLLQAEESGSETTKDDSDNAYQKWTFYKLATINGFVTLKWWGDSPNNSYYSLEVNEYYYDNWELKRDYDHDYYDSFDDRCITMFKIN